MTRVYIVLWCDQEGNQQQRPILGLSNAQAEAEYLRLHYDGVHIIRESDGKVVE